MQNGIENALGDKVKKEKTFEENSVLQQIKDREKRIKDILMWDDVTPQDRVLIGKLENEIEELTKKLEEEKKQGTEGEEVKEEVESVEKKKEKFFQKIDKLGGEQGEIKGSSDVSYSVDTLKRRANEILSGERSINGMTRMEGLRDDLMEIMEKAGIKY